MHVQLLLAGTLAPRVLHPHPPTRACCVTTCALPFAAAGIKMDAEVQRALHKEVDLMRKMRHPNIILFMGVVAEPAAVVTGGWGTRPARQRVQLAGQGWCATVAVGPFVCKGRASVQRGEQVLGGAAVGAVKLTCASLVPPVPALQSTALGARCTVSLQRHCRGAAGMALACSWRCSCQLPDPHTWRIRF